MDNETDYAADEHDEGHYFDPDEDPVYREELDFARGICRECDVWGPIQCRVHGDATLEPTPTEHDLVTAARQVKATTADQHSTLTAWTILARSYSVPTKTSLRDAAVALKAACEKPDTDPEPPTGTDGPAREPGSDDGEGADPAGFEAHRAAQGEARAQVTELRVVREESSDPCVTSAAAWAAHLATLHSKWHVCGSFRKRASAFSAEGVHAAREAATLDRLRALGEAAPRTLLYAPPPAPKKRAA